MRTRVIEALKLFPVMLPIMFVLLFFGYAPVRFDVEMYMDNIEGEGLAQTYRCPDSVFSYLYRLNFYFGSQLEYVKIPGMHYDLESLKLEISDVTSAEFYGFTVKIFGINLGYYDMRQQIAPGHYGTEDGGVDVRLSEDGQRLRMEFLNPNTTSTISLHNRFLPAAFWRIYWAAMGLTTLLASLGMSFLWDRYPAMRVHLVSASGILATMIMGCLICGSLPYVEYLDFLLNFVVFFAVSLLINSLTLPFIGTVSVMGFALFWYIANYFVIAYRGKPVLPADLKAIGTAREVIGGYTLALTPSMWFGIATVVFFSAVCVGVWLKNRRKDVDRKKGWIHRGIGAAVAVGLFFLCVNSVVFSHLNSFQWDNKILQSFHSEGIALTFLKAEAGSRVKAPEGYSRETVRGYLKEYQGEPTQSVQGIQPTNIIMVMDEAFADLRTIGLDPSIDVMPFVDSLDKNTLEGRLAVSVFGGGTCNTEFEALTGNTLAFMAPGAYPYTENVRKPMFSLASYFSDLGYAAEAFHPNSADNWNRDVVYPRFGFDTFYSIKEFPRLTDETSLRNLPADTADFQFMASVGEELRGKPRFLFDVTMQNHSPYDRWEDVKKVDGVDGLYFNTQVYLSLVKASDAAIGQLVERYRDSDEPTMIVYFGDHMPGLPNGNYLEFSSDQSQMKRFFTKFFIWTNYETESRHDMTFSANYLPLIILERGNFELTPYLRMLKELYTAYPVVTAQGVIDAEGNEHGGVGDMKDDPLIRKYRYIQYAILFDELDDEWFDTEGIAG